MPCPLRHKLACKRQRGAGRRHPQALPQRWVLAMGASPAWGCAVSLHGSPVLRIPLQPYLEPLTAPSTAGLPPGLQPPKGWQPPRGWQPSPGTAEETWPRGADPCSCSLPAGQLPRPAFKWQRIRMKLEAPKTEPLQTSSKEAYLLGNGDKNLLKG